MFSHNDVAMREEMKKENERFQVKTRELRSWSDLDCDLNPDQSMCQQVACWEKEPNFFCEKAEFKPIDIFVFDIMCTQCFKKALSIKLSLLAE